LLQALAGPIERWHIQDVSIKLFPAIGTSQSALVAVLGLVRRHRLRAVDVEQVEVRFADLPVTREHLADPARRDPHQRETADHSIPFLVAAAIEDGELGPAQFADERWHRPSTRALMGRVSLLGDPALNAYAETDYPVVATITTTAGQTSKQEVLQVPGGPNRPLSDQALGEKLRRFAGASLPAERLEALEARLLHLDQESNMAEVGALLRGEDPEGNGRAGQSVAGRT
jgi:2-methylcitrate dehydratase